MVALVDTSALLALARTKDQHHERALEIADRHLAAGGRFVGTTLVLGELHAHLLRLRGPHEARIALLMLLEDPVHEWVEVSAELVWDASEWLSRFSDQTFTLVDAVSFELMGARGVEVAFAFDADFVVAGYQLLD